MSMLLIPVENPWIYRHLDLDLPRAVSVLELEVEMVTINPANNPTLSFSWPWQVVREGRFCDRLIGRSAVNGGQILIQTLIFRLKYLTAQRAAHPRVGFQMCQLYILLARGTAHSAFQFSVSVQQYYQFLFTKIPVMVLVLS